jgi:hypothetical protein
MSKAETQSDIIRFASQLEIMSEQVRDGMSIANLELYLFARMDTTPDHARVTARYVVAMPDLIIDAIEAANLGYYDCDVIED